MGLYYIGQKSRMVKRQTGLGSQFERIRQKKKAAAEKAALDTARVSLLQTFSKHVETTSAIPETKAGETTWKESSTPIVPHSPGATPAGAPSNDVNTHASNDNSRGRDRQSRRK